MQYSMSLEHVEYSESINVSKYMFGNNILTSTNTDEGAISEDFVEAVETVRSARLRYPAGRAELDDITALSDEGVGVERLTPNFASYLEYVKGKGVDTTLVLPSLNFEAGDEAGLQEWVQIVLDYMGEDIHLIQAFEIGNEYWGSASETTYGQNASAIAQALREALPEGTNVEILIQTANVVGGHSLYKGGDNGNISSGDAISALSHWSEEERPTDWSEGMTASNYYYSLSSFEQRILEANLELLQYFDDNNNIADGFQASVQGNLFDGVVAHYYYDKNYQEFDTSDNASRDQNKYLDLRFSPWEAMIEQDISLQITEWNVESDHYNDLGLKAAGALVEQFENMLELGVDAADFWTLRHNTTSAAAGSNGDSGVVRLTPAGSALQMMHESMVFADGSTLAHRQVAGFDGSQVNVNYFSDAYTSVIYLSSRVEEFDFEVSLDASFLPDSSFDWYARQIGMDIATSDGLSENRAYDEDGNLVSRAPRREIDEQERLDLIAKLGSAYSDSYVKVIDGRLLTYLPEADDILLRPEVSSPSTLDDFYFSSETDVSSFVWHQDMDDLGLDLSNLTFVFDPYEVVELTVQHSRFETGGDGSESMLGGRGVDVILGEGGDDTIFGFEDNDSLKGQLGDDSLSGGDGQDTLVGGWGNDTLLGGAGADYLTGGEGSDTIFGDSDALSDSPSIFDDTIDAGNGDDFVFGGTGGDVIYAGEGNDVVNGGLGRDYVLLESGDDYYSAVDASPTADADTVFGGNGNDTIRGSHGGDHLLGENGNDEILGAYGNDSVRGGAGRDSLFGGYGNDSLYGGDQYDTLFGDAGDDLVDGGNGADLAYLGEGNDTFIDNDLATVDGRDTVFGGWGDDTILGRGADDVFHGDGGADLIEGGDGNDLLYGGAQYDTLTGGDGRDTVYGGNGRDLAFLGTGADVFVDNDLAGADGSDTVYGGWGNDTITGDAGDDYFDGQGNDDSITAGDGHDTVLGGDGRDFAALNAGHDLFIDSAEGGLEGRDTVYGGWGNDTLQGGGGDDSFFGNWDHDLIEGGDGNDTLSGDDGDDTLAGEAGDDLLTGGTGADSFVFAIGTSHDVISDFEQGSDQVLIDTALTGAGTIADLINGAQVGGGGVTVNFATGGSVFFDGLTGTSGLADDFDFVV